MGEEMSRTDKKCFALTEDRQCDALEHSRCIGYKTCPFYKSCAQNDADVQKAYLRIRSLYDPMQMYIADAYYGGHMPWKIHDGDPEAASSLTF